MTQRVFVDTDVILDLLLRPRALLRRGDPILPPASGTAHRRLHGTSGFSNLFYILRQGMPVPEAITALRKLRLLVSILPVGEGTVDAVLASSFADFEGGLQYSAATASSLDEECVQWIER